MKFVELPELGGAVQRYLFSQPGVDEGFALAGAMSTLRQVATARWYPWNVGMPASRYQWSDIYLLLVHPESDRIHAAMERLLPDSRRGMWPWFDFYDWELWYRPRILFPKGGRVSRSFTPSAPPPDLLEQIEAMTATRMPVLTTPGAVHAYHLQTARLTTLTTFDDQEVTELIGHSWQTAALYIAAGTENRVITPEILELAWTIAGENHVAAWNRLKYVGLAG